MTLEAAIDDLYRSSLADFVGARTALAKTLTGAEAQRVRQLAKPTVVPWAVNQVYWRARPTYDALIKSGERFRHAQVAALEGRKADIRTTTDAYRRTIADAVRKAEDIAAAKGLHPATDALTRTFEALSMRQAGDDAPGRLTRPLQPAGFEALAGVKVAPKTSERLEARKLADEAAARDKKREDGVRRKHQAQIKKAEAALERARRRMEEAQAALKQTRGQ